MYPSAGGATTHPRLSRLTRRHPLPTVFASSLPFLPFPPDPTMSRVVASPSQPLLLLLLLVVLPDRSAAYFPEERWSPESPLLSPRVVIALVCRNSEHSLPLVLGALEHLDYPKDRIALW